jgi:hypothetical protein
MANWMHFEETSFFLKKEKKILEKNIFLEGRENIIIRVKPRGNGSLK